MKRTFRILLTVLTVATILAGCQKTPESPFVISKSTETMLERAQVDGTLSDNGASVVDLYARLDAPGRYTADLLSKGGHLSVHVDAQVYLPDRELSISRIRPVAFSTEEVKVFTDALFGGNAHYIESGDVKTKGVYQHEIDQLRAALDDWENTGTYQYDMVYNTREEAEQALANMLTLAVAAPEELPYSEPDFRWQTINASVDGNSVATADSGMMLFAMPDNATVSRMDIDNSLETRGAAEMRYWRDVSVMLGALSTESADVSDTLYISQEDAYAIAQNTIARMQLSDFACSAQQANIYRLDPSGMTTKAVYDFMFTRVTDSVAQTYTNDDESNAGGYNKSWLYEKIHVLVDDEGVYKVVYTAPCEVVETIMLATSLLPFNTVKDIFEKMVVIADNLVDTDTSGYTEKYVITSVRLGLMSVREQDCETGLLIPVWDFLGYSESESEQHGFETLNTNELESFLTINAIDGSIIQRGNGY
jgi:hypothetical protein